MVINEAENELTCDFASYYHIYDIYQFTPLYIAVLCSGLPTTSRTIRKISKINNSEEEILLATIADRLGLLVWMRSEDGRKGINRPESIVDIMLGNKKKEGGIRAFDSAEELDAALAEFKE